MESSLQDPPRASYRSRVVVPLPALVFVGSVAFILYKCFA
jgi:hypothetical protein